jgi:cell division septum initiation protein DivIVA
VSQSPEIPYDVESRLQALEEMVADAKSVPLSSSVMVNRAEVEALVTELREVMPDELAQARWLVRDRDRILETAREDADRILSDARTESERLVSQQHVVTTARIEADEILARARENARRVKLEAEDYVDAKLANFEVVLTKIKGTVERGRETLRGRLDVDQLADDELRITSERDGWER